MMIQRLLRETIRQDWRDSATAILVVIFALSVVAGSRGSGERSAAGTADLELTRSSIDGGGVTRATGGAFELSGTIGQADAGAMMTGGEFEVTGGFWFRVVTGDANGDGVVDLVDYEAFEGCLAGPGSGAPDDQCSSFDTDGNGTVDLADFAAVQTAFTGS